MGHEHEHPMRVHLCLFLLAMIGTTVGALTGWSLILVPSMVVMVVTSLNNHT